MAYSTDGLFVELDNLEGYGENVGRRMKPSGSLPASGSAHQLRARLEKLGRIHAALARQSEEETATGAAEWLLDNWYLAKREGMEAVQKLRATGRLRAVSMGRDAGETALITALAEAFVHSGRGTVTAERCERFLLGFQKTQVLSRKELDLFTAAVRAALVGQILELAQAKEKQETRHRIREGMGRAFSSLRLLSTLDLSEVLERVNHMEQILLQDPAGVYPRMDERTRESYREKVSQLAQRYHCMEHRVAQKVLQLAKASGGEKRHVGYYLFEAPLGREKKRSDGGMYIAANVLLTLFVSVLIGFLTRSAVSTLLLLFPVSELVKNLLDFILLRILKPAHVPRMELAEGIPVEGRTLCAVSDLLTGPESGKKLARRLEEYRLANRDAGENLLFAILADLPESDQAEISGAQDWIDAAAAAINQLNQKYSGGFYLLYRERSRSETDGKYRGWERKRGAITELARLLHGDGSSLQMAAGSALGLHGVRYILALDADTRLCPGTARELVGAMLHPMNRAVIDQKRRVVTAGYGVLAPRMSVELSAAGKNTFSRIFAGQGGTDPYGSCSGEVYMDMLGRAGFAGKGIMDVEAFVTCLAERIPENTVLSHDILEGAYLRGGYMSDVELTDGFPSRPTAYFRRMERWIRGDWQNIPWLLRRGRDLPEIERWRIFDNLRRSFAAPMTFTSLIAGFLIHSTALRWTAAAAVLAFISNLLLLMADAAFRPVSDTRVRYHSTIIHGVWGGFLQAAVRLLLLPAEAITALGAILTALWRMLISHKNMLQWQTAAQAEAAAEDKILVLYRVFWPCVVYGVLCMAFAVPIIGKTLGLLWFFTPVLARELGRDARSAAAPEAAEQNYLLQCAKEMWHFYEQFCTPEEHFLPPDNYQQSPPVGVAHRTSPTNIGLCLLCALAADDLQLAPTHRCMGLISNVLDTMERLPKWHGHLYNWIDTRTLETLRPGYVSTVDSGNLAGCLVALRHGLEEKGREDLASRAAQLYADMDFTWLYDEKRRLFHIGWDAGTKTLTEGWYDLLSSEARLTGYVAIARGDVPRKHWRRLGRAQLQKDGYRGMASWTGTMFEYLMPELLMPCWKDSLIYESAKFCLYCQKKRTAALRLPWGASESAFAALDAMLNYQYKAHGVSALALRRGMDTELVISPYSSFLALAVEPAAALRNLRQLDRIGARGPWGFWEAVDFTPERLSAGEPYSMVRCVMAHHVGMSLLSVANHLQNGVMRRRFMAEPAMAAYAGLLQEKVPIGGTLLRRDSREIPLKPRHSEHVVWEKQGQASHFSMPECCLLSNGFYNIMSTETGAVTASCRELTPYRGAHDRFAASHGMDFYLQEQQREISLLPVSGVDGDGEYRWHFRPEQTEISLEGEGFAAKVETAVAASEPGELRIVTLQGTAQQPRSCRLLLRFEAVLARFEDYVNHPAYFGLGLHAHLEDGVLLVRRLERGKLEECWLALACSEEMSVCALQDRAVRVDVAEGLWLTGGRLEAAVDILLQAHAPQRIRYALCVAKTAEGARDAALRTLHIPASCRAALPGASAVLLGLEHGLTGAYSLLQRVHFSTPDADAAAQGRHALWEHGISGDLPILCAQIQGERGLREASELLRQHALLSVCGQKFDLVLLNPDGGDYRQPALHALWSVLHTMKRERSVGERGGVHFVADTPENLRLFQGAGILLGLADTEKRDVGRNSKLNIMSTQFPREQETARLQFRFAEDGAFHLDASETLPPRAWSNMLSNGELGYIATERGTGHMWYRNAREAQVTAWSGDANSVVGSEHLKFMMSTNSHDLFAAPGDGRSAVEYDFGAAVWYREFGQTRVRTTAFVPVGTESRVLLIETEGANDGSLVWCMEPLMASGDADRCALRCRREGEVLLAENPRFLYPEKQLRIAASAAWLGYACDRVSWLRGDMSGSTGAGRDACLSLQLPAADRLVIVCGFDAPEKLRELARPETAQRLLSETKRHWRETCCTFTINTPDPMLDRYLNGWAAYQTLAGRVLGRASVYQSGGAFGFRDQLQDAVNLLLLTPELTRRQILSACAHQFVQGDVQHWWHSCPDGARGVRTRCSDDLLWLPWAVCEYVDATGDTAICAEHVAFLQAQPLRAEEESRYETPARTAERATVLEHAFRALETVIARGTGAHGLLKMLSGDWNDGFDQVGAQERGESVWLSWFFAHTAARFAALAKQLDAEEARIDRIAKAGEAVGNAANAAWDGEWYLRGWFDDGTPLGTRIGGVCRIDSVAQSFSALCTEADPSRRASALDSAASQLFDRAHGLVRLFTPPFADSTPNPGYIMSYGPGFRENGGQYTHGAIWLAMALLMEGRTDEGYALLHALLPNARDWERYGAEPFVLAADVYAASGHEGRAGWSWYTGSAGWMLRVALCELLGLRLEHGQLQLRPRLPSGWEGFSIDYQDENGVKHRWEVDRVGVRFDGKRVETEREKAQP